MERKVASMVENVLAGTGIGKEVAGPYGLLNPATYGGMAGAVQQRHPALRSEENRTLPNNRVTSEQRLRPTPIEASPQRSH